METTFDLKILNNLYEDFIEIIPKVLGVIAFIIISYLLLKLILFLVRKSLKLTKLDSLLSKLNDKNPIFSTSSKLQPTKIILMFVKWFLILIFIVVGADILGLTMVSNEVSKIIQYLPKLFTAVLIFFIGTYGAVLLRKTIQSALKSIDVNGAKAISLIVFYFVFVMVAIMTLNQAGIDTEIITKNLFFIICAFLAALTIALGLGSRDVVLRLLLGFYSRKNFPIGKRIKFDDVEGAVIAIDNISLVLEKNDGKKIVIPIKKIANKQVEIID